MKYTIWYDTEKKLEIARFGMTRPRGKIDTIRLDTVISHYRHDTVRHGMSEYRWVRTRLDTEPSTDDTVGHGFKWMQIYTVWHTAQHGWTRFAFLDNTVVHGLQLLGMV